MGLNIGDTIYKYKLIRKLGAGAFGQVWLAEDTSINNTVALKILPSDFKNVATVLEEARIGHKFNHDNLLQIHYADIITLNDGSAITLIAQDYKPNGTVERLLNTHNFLDAPILLRVLKDILYGLEYLHNSNIFHNDIKPGNILLGDKNIAILADYGISGITLDGNPIIPKDTYIVHGAPETLSSTPIINIHTDIYQVGCTAYRLANGISTLRDEFSNNSSEYQQRVLNGEISNKKHGMHVPIKLASIIKKAMSLDPNDRYLSALEMRRDLEKLSFAGYWTVDPHISTELIGKGAKYDYKFEKNLRPGNTFDFTATKVNKSGRRTRVTQFCKKSLNAKDVAKIEKEYYQWVIKNAT